MADVKDTPQSDFDDALNAAVSGETPSAPAAAAPEPAPVDPGQASLSRALNLSFTLLKVLMLAVLALFALSCMRSIQEGEIGLVRRFGEHVRDENGAVRIFRTGRPYFIWPEPLEQLEIVRTGTNTLHLYDDFWTQTRANVVDTTPNVPASKSELVPATDGYTLTGDFNIVHSRWRIDFSVDDEHPEDYFNALAVNQLGLTPEERHDARLDLLRLAARASIVKVLAGLPVDDLLGGDDAADPARVAPLVMDEIRRRMAHPEQPGRYRGGFRVERVIILANEPPGQVKPDFRRVTESGIEAEARKTRALAERNAILAKARTESNKIVEDALVYQKTVVANARADAERIQAFLERFPSDAAGLAVAANQYRLDRLKTILAKARTMRLPDGGDAAWPATVLTIAPPADLSATP